MGSHVDCGCTALFIRLRHAKDPPSTPLLPLVLALQDFYSGRPRGIAFVEVRLWILLSRLIWQWRQHAAAAAIPPSCPDALPAAALSHC